MITITSTVMAVMNFVVLRSVVTAAWTLARSATMVPYSQTMAATANAALKCAETLAWRVPLRSVMTATTPMVTAAMRTAC